MSLIGKKVGSFKKNAYYNDEFIEVANKDIADKWSIFFAERYREIGRASCRERV